ncbi:MAG: HPr family phosphocarrier protein [Lachnospiraceae bacterium]|nr:HPr family phosphocarrier protein [Lachnospiraceae bacterium]
MTQTFTVVNSDDHDFDIATRIVNVASQFRSRIDITSGERTVNAKSVMGMTVLALVEGEEVTVSCFGEDEEKAMEAVKAALTR